MTFRPADHDEFFQALGASRVRKALVNREVRGETEKAAIRWLEQNANQASRRWVVLGVWGTVLVGLLAAGATVLAGFIPAA